MAGAKAVRARGGEERKAKARSKHGSRWIGGVGGRRVGQGPMSPYTPN